MLDDIYYIHCSGSAGCLRNAPVIRTSVIHLFASDRNTLIADSHTAYTRRSSSSIIINDGGVRRPTDSMASSIHNNNNAARIISFVSHKLFISCAQ